MARAGRDFAILDIQNDDDELQFQDFGLSGRGNTRHGNGQTHVFTDFPDSPGHQTDTDKLLGEYRDDDELTTGTSAANSKSSNDSGKARSFWTFEYYQQYFDVDSKRVGDRIVWSMVPKPGVSYLEIYVRPKPDLYGPFWVCLTLVFAAAISGNVSNYLQTQGNQTQHWRYDFHKVSLAAGMVFVYGWLLPLALWAALRYRSSRPSLSLLDLLCLYGYSLSVLVPVCVVWTVPVLWLRWCVGIVGVVLSGAVLAKAVWEGLKGGEVEAAEEGEDDGVAMVDGVARKVAIVMVVVVVLMHVAIAMGFMLYFFSEPVTGSSHASVINTPMVPSLPAAALNSSSDHAPTPLSANVKDIAPTKRDLSHSGKAGGDPDTGVNAGSTSNVSGSNDAPQLNAEPSSGGDAHAGNVRLDDEHGSLETSATAAASKVLVPEKDTVVRPHAEVKPLLKHTALAGGKAESKPVLPTGNSLRQEANMADNKLINTT